MAKLKMVIERGITNAAEAVGDVIGKAGALVGRRAATKPAATKKATRRKPAARKAIGRKTTRKR